MKVFFRNIKSNILLSSDSSQNLFFTDQNGIVRGFGNYNFTGQLGNNTTNSTIISESFVSPAGGRIYSQVHAAKESVFALEEGTGILWAWGGNSSGQLGNGTTASQSSPVSVLGDIRFRSISLGGYNVGHVAGGIDIAGNTWLWGDNRADFSVPTELRAPESYSPRKIITNTSFSKVFATSGSQNQGMALEASTGKLWGWGSNQGELGNNTTSSVIASPSLLGDRSYIQVEKPHWQTLALDSSGVLWTFGRALGGGELGNGTNINGVASSPVSVLSNRSFNKIYSYVNYNPYNTTFTFNTNCFAIDSDGYAWAWGFNLGALGDGTTTNASTPVSVATNKKFSTIQSALIVDGGGGAFNNCLFAAIDSSTGHLYTWGRARDGALGDNSTASRSAPVSVHSGGRSFTQVTTAPASNVIALDGDGYAWAWGSGVNGRNGDNTVTSRSTPVSVVGNRRFKQVASAGTFVVALEASTGLAYSWGSNTNGYLADGSLLSRSSPVAVVGGRSYSFLTVCNDQISPIVYLISDGQVYGWGSNSGGMLGDGTIINRSSPVSVISAKSFNYISGDLYPNGIASAIEASTGHIWSWGTQLTAALGRGATALTCSPRKLEGYQFKKLAAGETFALGLTASGQLYSWGQSTSGALGTGTTTSFFSPSLIPGTWSDMITSRSNTMAIESSTGQIWSWGSGNIIGDNSITGKSTPVTIATNKSFTKLAYVTGLSAAALEGSTGFAYSWGNGNGGLGDGTTVSRSSPVLMLGGRSYSDIIGFDSGFFLIEGKSNFYVTGNLGTSGWAPRYMKPVLIGDGGGRSYTTLFGVSRTSRPVFALDSSGYLWAWGNNNSQGVLGLNTTHIEYDTPTSVPGGIVFKSIYAGGERTYGIEASTGRIYGWGNGSSTSPIGDNTLSARSSPTLMAGARSYSLVCAADTTALAIEASTGLVYSWGNGSNGILAYGNTTARSSPITVAGGRSYSLVRFLSSFPGVAGAIEGSTGRAWLWGQNTPGSLGDGTVSNRSTPVSVVGGRSFIDIRGAGAGNSSSIYALEGSTGQILSWGYNLYGSLGDGSTSNRSTPVTVLGTRSYSAIRTGLSAFSAPLCVALEGSTGMAYCWGGDTANLGILGDGTTRASSSTPVAVAGGRSYKDIQVGSAAIFAIEGSTGHLYAWGGSGGLIGGTLGDGTTSAASSPISIPTGGKSFSSLLGGQEQINFQNSIGNFGAIEGSTGQIYMWGDKTNFLGNSNYKTSYRSPTSLPALKIPNT